MTQRERLLQTGERQLARRAANQALFQAFDSIAPGHKLTRSQRSLEGFLWLCRVLAGLAVGAMLFMALCGLVDLLVSLLDALN